MAQILVIDPRPRYRRTLAARLGDRVTVESLPDATRASELVAALRPSLVVLSYLQPGAKDGLATAGELRELKESEGALFVVHGTDRTRVSDAEREALAKQHGVDVYLPTKLQPDRLAVELTTLLRRLAIVEERERTTSEKLKAIGSPHLAMMSARVQAEPSLSDILTRKAGPISEFPEEYEPSWTELLRAEVNMKNFLKLLRKDLTN